MNRIAQIASTPVPQSEPLDSRMTKNAAGGYAYEVDLWDQVDRFLILGSYGGTYYIKESRLTTTNIDRLKAALTADGPRLVARIVEVSDQGLALKNDFAIFTLSLCFALGDSETRKAVVPALPKVCRIATHLFMFFEDLKALGKIKWNRTLRAMVRAWYINGRTADWIAYQVCKYRQREGWTHRDLMRLSHLAVNKSDGLQAALHFAFTGEVVDDAPQIVKACAEAANADTERLVALIREHHLTQEMIPSERIKDKVILEALIEAMPPHALIRGLGKFAAAGASIPIPFDADKMLEKRVHPLSLLLAYVVYGSGRGEKSSLCWTPDGKVLDALHDAYESVLSRGAKIGCNALVSVDCSGSMDAQSSLSQLNCAEASGCFAHVAREVFSDVIFGKFGEDYKEVHLQKRMSLREVQHNFQANLGGTDLAQPVLNAKDGYDLIVIFTDNETWAGRMHAQAAWRKYRDRNPNAKLVVASIQANLSTVGDPQDKSVLQVSGFDASLFRVIEAFLGKGQPEADIE